MTDGKQPQPEPRHLLAALGTLLFEHRLKPDDFERHYLGSLTVDEIKQLDNMQWLQVSTPQDLQTFRDGSFEDASVSDFPPVIVVTYPVDGRCRTELRDGRGRVNYANAYGLRLNVWHFIHRNCSDQSRALRL